MTKTAALLIDDGAVAVAAAVALLLVAALVGAAMARGRALPVPTVTVAVVSIAVAVPGAEANTARYRTGPVESLPGWILALLVAALLSFAMIAVTERGSTSSREGLTLAVAAISVGLFLAVPETGILRLMPVPLLLIGFAVGWRRLPPFGPVATTLSAVGLAWVTLVDGATESTSVLGLVVALSLASLLPRLGSDAENRGRARAAQVILLVAIVISCRVVGTAATGTVALGYSALIAASVVVIAMTGNMGGLRTASTRTPRGAK